MQGAVFRPPPLLCEAGRSRVTLHRASPIPGSDDADETSLGRRSVVARVNTVAFLGVEVVEVDVQVQISPGLPAYPDCCHR